VVRVGKYHFLFHPDQVEEVLETHADRFERVASERRVSGRLVDDALFASEGERHAGQREVMEPVMYRHAPEALAGVVAQLGGWMRDSLSEGQTMDLFQWTESTTTTEMVQLLFGLEPADPGGRRMAGLIREAIYAMDHIFLGFSRIPDHVGPLMSRFRRARAELDRAIAAVISERREAGSGDGDILGMLAGSGLSEVEIRNELVTLFRGHQAVSTGLTWTFYQLASLPEVESRMHAEIDAVTGGGERLPGPEDLDRLDYTRRTFQESLRLMPPAWVLARLCVQDHAVGQYVVPKGAQVLLTEWVTHRDERWWADPSRFDPDRFTPEIESKRPRYAYFPQGGGPKMCMGKHLVVPVEAPLLLAAVAGRWRMRLAPGFEMELAPKATLKPKHGIRVVVERRA
jgi:cytochrome P450